MTPEDMFRDVARGLANSDLAPLFGIIDENTVWISASAPGGAFRFGGEYQRRAGVVEVTALIATTYHFTRFEPREIMSQGEVLWALVDAEAQYRPTGKTLKTAIAIRWRVRDGKLLEHQAFFDTAHVLEQQSQIA